MYKGIIKGNLYWPWLNKIHQMSGKYQVTIGQLDKDLAKTLKEAGGVVKKDDKMGYCITVKSKNRPEVKDCQLNNLDDSTINSIGNGTLAEVSIALAPSKFAYASHYLNGVKIVDLIKREGTAGGTPFEKTEGFVANRTTDAEFTETSIDDGEFDPLPSNVSTSA